MSERKTMFRFFTPDRFDEEEYFLTEMSDRGWQFINFSWGFYYFERDLSVKYNYKLDLKKDLWDLKDMKNYRKIHEDCGWENIHEFRVGNMAWEYFRKEESLGGDHLFTDDESKIELLARIRNSYLLVCLAAFILNLGINILNISLYYQYYLKTPWEVIFTVLPAVVMGALFLLYLKIFIRLHVKIKKLKIGRHHYE